MQGGDIIGENDAVSAAEKRQSRFIIGAVLGGVFVYYLTGSNILLTAIGALAVGYLLSRWG